MDHVWGKLWMIPEKAEMRMSDGKLILVIMHMLAPSHSLYLSSHGIVHSCGRQCLIAFMGVLMMLFQRILEEVRIGLWYP
jgi:hypothetical protein